MRPSFLVSPEAGGAVLEVGEGASGCLRVAI